MGPAMSISSIFNHGVKGMAASQLATNVTASNITNAATAGYSRRVANITPDHSLVNSDKSQRVVEPLLHKRLLNAQAGAGESAAQKAAVQTLDQVFAEGEGTVGDALDKFQVSMQELSTRPEDQATREKVLATANGLAMAFQNASAAIKQARGDASTGIADEVQQVNARLNQISKLGAEIQQAEGAGFEASELRDQRDLLIGQVADRIPVTVNDHGNGMISVTLGGGQDLVGPDGKVSPLLYSPDTDGSPRIMKNAAGTITDVTNYAMSGSIGGKIKAWEGPLAEAGKRLDQLAAEVADGSNKPDGTHVKGYNEVHAQGFGLDGDTGLSLFSYGSTTEDAAANFVVSSDVAGSPDKLAAADSTGGVSNNENALALASLSGGQIASAWSSGVPPIAIGGSITVTEALASLTGYAGSEVSNAIQADSFASGALEQVQSLNENATGVSSDEEMVALMRYQRAYQASLKVIQTADQMLSDLMSIR